jgi:hypothetical protein
MTIFDRAGLKRPTLLEGRMMATATWRRVLGATATVVLVTTLTNVYSAGVANAAGVKERISGTTTGTTKRALANPETRLLDEFRFRYKHGDQHLRYMGAIVREGTSHLQISFSDVNEDNSYDFTVGHQRVSGTGIVTGYLNRFCVSSCSVPIAKPAGDYQFVVMGFLLQYVGVFEEDDHQVDEIGVAESDGVLRAWLNDRNNDDLINAQVRYAWVPRSMLGKIVTSQGTRTDGFGTYPAQPGAKVLMGFRFDQTVLDNHVREIGVLLQPNTFEVRFYDDVPSNSGPWTFAIKYAQLK